MAAHLFSVESAQATGRGKRRMIFPSSYQLLACGRLGAAAMKFLLAQP
ncbi:MAG TPA: hypothetical protein VIY49_09575 [Bryobacteraceae bacterium]